MTKRWIPALVLDVHAKNFIHQPQGKFPLRTRKDGSNKISVLGAPARDELVVHMSADSNIRAAGIFERPTDKETGICRAETKGAAIREHILEQQSLHGIIVHSCCLLESIQAAEQFISCVLAKGTVVRVSFIAEARRWPHEEAWLIYRSQHEGLGHVEAPEIQAELHRKSKESVVGSFRSDGRVHSVGIEVAVRDL